MELTLRQQTKKWDVCFWLGYTKDINFTIDWDSGFKSIIHILSILCRLWRCSRR